MTRHWAERAYAILVAMYPREIREQHGTEIKLVFRDLLHDPEVSAPDLVRRVLCDLRNLSGGGTWLGALFGSLVLLVWWVNRSDVIPFDPTAGLVLIALLFVGAGFVGTWRSGSFAGGFKVGFVAGLLSAVTVPGDYLLFQMFPFYDLVSLMFTMAIAAAVVMLLVTAGAAVRLAAWRRDHELVL